MQNNYDGPPEKFAMVVPVPVVLKKEDVKTLPQDIFDRIDKLSAPRLVEYWEQDPCTASPIGLIGSGFGRGGAGAGFGGRGDGGEPVKIEAQFAVGEYDIVILSAQDALALETWLTTNGYVIPAGAAEHLQPYVAGGSKFFVAKVDPKKVKFDAKGMATLSPLRIHYPSDDFRLPIRLGLINADGPQDLIVHILSTAGRFEAANYPNVTLPTEILVKEEVKATFPAFYAALFDGLLARNPGAVVTEYAWDARNCDPCPDQPLDSTELASLGLDVLFDGIDGAGFPGVRLPLLTVDGPLDRDIARRIIRAHVNEVRYCYNQALAKNPGSTANLTVDFTINELGKVPDATSTGGAAHDGLDQCVASAFKRWTFPKEKKPTKVQAPIGLIMQPGGGQRPFVLTRLHARYDAATLGEDLVFRAADGIANGSHGPQGPFVQAPQPSSINLFQGRFIVRHPWTGPIDCKEPVRGVYGGPPKGMQPDKQTQAVTNAAFAPRDGTDVTKCVEEPIAALTGPAAPPSPAKPDTPPVSFDPPATPATPTTPAAAGCSCTTQSSAPPALLVLIPLLLRRRPRHGARR